MASKEERAQAIEMFANTLANFALQTTDTLTELKGVIEGMRDSGQIDVEDYSVYEPEFEQAAATMHSALDNFSDSQATRLINLAAQIRGVAF